MSLAGTTVENKMLKKLFPTWRIAVALAVFSAAVAWALWTMPQGDMNLLDVAMYAAIFLFGYTILAPFRIKYDGANVPGVAWAFWVPTFMLMPAMAVHMHAIEAPVPILTVSSTADLVVLAAAAATEGSAIFFVVPIILTGEIVTMIFRRMECAPTA